MLRVESVKQQPSSQVLSMEIPVALVAPRIGSGRYIFVEFVDPLGVDFNKIYATVNILKTPKTTFIKHSPSS